MTTQETIDWPRQTLERDRTRLHDTARDAAGTPGGRVLTRVAMDQVSDIAWTLKIIDIAEKAADEDPRFGQIVAWIANSHAAAPGYLDTWAPDEVDLVATMRLLDSLDDEPDDDLDDEPGR